MPRYSVCVTRDVTESTFEEVEADSPEEAKEKALANVQAEPWDFDWTLDDGNIGGEPYLASDEDPEVVGD